MSPQLEELWLENALCAYEKQLHLAELIGQRSWAFSMDNGMLTFLGRGFLQRNLSLAAQILGSESEEGQTWLWSWANSASEIPENLLQAAKRLRELGQERSVPELIEPEISLEQADGHTLSIIASGVLQAGAYYRGPYEGGAAFLLIQDTKFLAIASDVPRTLRVISEGISALEIANHRYAITAYLAQNDWNLSESGEKIVGTRGKHQIQLRFDELNRMIEMETTLSGS